MGRSPCCCHDAGVKKGPWTEDEDRTLVEHIQRRGGHVSSWRNLPRAAGLNRCGKSCRLRWTNYLRPDIRRGNFTDDEERLIIALHADLGNKWSTIATHLEGRTDNEIKNYWNTHIRKKLVRAGVDPVTHRRLPPDVGILNGALASPGGPPAGTLLCAAASSLRGQLNPALMRQAQALQLLLQVIGTCGSSNGSANALLGNCNLPTGNAMFTNNVNTSVASDLQDQMVTIFSQANNQQSAGYSYPPNSTAAANFAEQGMVQQYLKSSAPSPCCGSLNGVPAAADQYCDTTATLERPAYPQEVAAAGVDLPVPVPSFTDMLGLDDEMPNLYSLEEDGRFWDDMLHNSFSL